MISKQTAFNFLFGLIFNQSIKSDVAWQAPKELKKRMGVDIFEPEWIVELGLDKFQEYFFAKPCLHRFPANMAKNVYQASQVILEEFAGDPRQIWQGQDIKTITNNLQKISGIGPHKAKLGVVILQKIDSRIIPKTDENNYQKICEYVNVKCPNLLPTIHEDLEYILEDENRKMESIHQSEILN